MLAKAGGRYRIFREGAEHVASLRGRFKQDTGEQVLVGDRVDASFHVDGSVTIEAVRPRRSVLRRRTPGRRKGIRPVAANLDLVLVVGSAARPAWDPAMVDRFVSVAVASDLEPLIVINKADLAEGAFELGGAYRRAGFAVLVVSAETGDGIAELRAAVAGRTALLTGSTGVGKSSLANRLEPGLELRTSPVSGRTGVGRHTTVVAEMYATADGGFLVDTPGLRDIGLWGLERQDVERAFPDVAEAAAECRFDDCRHRGEPSCAVRLAAESGTLPSERLASYHRLVEEAEAASRPWE